MKDWEKTLKGKISYNLKAKEWSWLNVGGAPLFTFIPEHIEDLIHFFKVKPEHIKFRTLGASSNLLINDKEFDGIFIRLGKNFRKIEIKNELIIAEAGLLGSFITQIAAKAELGGISFMQTIPGQLGGMIKMNAGAHNQEMKDIIQWVKFMDKSGKINIITNKECAFDYRKSIFQEDWIILQAAIKTKKQKTDYILKEIQELMFKRKQTQPTQGKMAGCFFKNHKTMPAWQAIRESNIVNHPNIKISEIHANFLINNNQATAQEISEFIKKIQHEVFLKHKIHLELEIEKIGF